MNLIYLKGIMKNIRYSHTIEDVIFNKADLIVKRQDGREDILIVKFKQFSIDCKEDAEVELVGNIRSFSQQLGGKNKVEIYVFSYFDEVTEDYELPNVAKLSGRICKKDTLRTNSRGKHYIHLILANNLITDNGQRLNSYIPCVAWGNLAKSIEQDFKVGDILLTEGQLHSREYKKKLSEDEVEIRIAHEYTITSLNRVDKDEI